jgi:acyl-coenzyme A synthetase/AMP-(fatty) acid ligase
LQPVPLGEEGVISVPDTDPGLFINYWNQPEETAKHKHDGWFITGDFARMDADGYIWFLGRKDDIIKSFGFRVSPYEVERVLKSHPEVADCASVAETIEKDKVLVVAYIILQSGSTATADDLYAFGKKHLAAYKAPKVVYITDQFPRTKNGKILRRDVNPTIALSRSNT